MSAAHRPYEIIESLFHLDHHVHTLAQVARDTLGDAEYALLHALHTQVDAVRRLLLDQYGLTTYNVERWLIRWCATEAVAPHTNEGELVGWLQIHPHAPDFLDSVQRYLLAHYPGSRCALELFHDPESGSRHLVVHVRLHGTGAAPVGPEQYAAWHACIETVHAALLYDRPYHEWGDISLALDYAED